MRTIRNSRLSIVSGAVFASTLVCTGGASAALDEIVVTAQKREQGLQRVPIAVSAFDADDLELRGFSRISDLAFAVPNLNIVSPSDARATQFTIRGITGQTLFPGAESAVGIFVDGIFINNPIAQNFDVLDVERVEVLRGPQGTLYGKNTTAGAINLISKKPSDEFHASGMVEIGNFVNRRVRGSLSGPIVDGKVMAGVSGTFQRRDGFTTNTFLDQDLNTADVWGLRGTVRLTPNENLEINLSGDYLKEDRVPSIADTTPFDREDELDTRMFEEREVFGGTATVDYALNNGAQITSLTSYREYSFKRLGDDDGTIFPAFISPVTESTWQLSEELRIASPTGDRLEWLAGLFYLHTELTGTSNPAIDPDLIFTLNVGVSCTALFTGQFILLGLAPGPAAAAATAACAANVGDNDISQTTNTIAGFGQTTFHINDQWSVTGGLRVSWEKKRFQNVQEALNPGFAIALAPGDAEFAREDLAISPKFVLSYQPVSDMNLYASVSRGEKSGGFNTGPIASPLQLDTTEYGEESLWSYELGVKSEFFDNRLRINLSGFYIDYKDLQVFSFEEVSAGVFSSRIANAASARSTGVEVEVTANLFEGFTLAGGAGYTNAKYEDFTTCGVSNTFPPMSLDCSNNRLTNAPTWTSTLSGTYVTPIPNISFANFMINGEWAYRGETFYDVFNNDTARQEGFSVFNGTAGFVSSEGDLSIVAYAKNIADKDYVVLAIPGFGGQQIQELGAPRTFGVRVNAKY